MDEKIFNGKKLVIIDLDGTLGKLDVDWVASRKLFEEYSLKEFEIKFKEGMRLDEMENFLVNKFGLGSFDKIFCKRRIFESEGVIGSNLNQELVEKMKSLKARNIKIAIYSNNLFETVNNFLSFHKLGEFVDISVGVNKNIPPKPDPLGMKKILDATGISVKDSLFIGDNDSTDGKVAKILEMDYLDIQTP